MKRNWLIHDNTGRYWLVFGGDGAVLVGTWRYWVSITWYCYWVSKGLLCLYILKTGDLVGCHHSGTTTKEQGKIELLSQ